MLAKILEDMWVDPDVLEALSEEQKRILFLKMREEQVRRWRVREEEEERTGQTNISGTKKVKSKHVSWLLGRDGDVCVSVIGDVDEFRASKLLQNINNRLLGDNLNGIQTEEPSSGRDAAEQGFKEDVRTALTDDEVSSSPHTSSEEDMDLKETDSSDSESGSSSDTPADWAPPLYRTHLRHHDNDTLLRHHNNDDETRLRHHDNGATQRDVERDGPRDKRDRDLVSRDEKPSCRGRVAELRKAFAADNSAPTSCSKPPVPTKPLHLQRQTVPCIH